MDAGISTKSLTQAWPQSGVGLKLKIKTDTQTCLGKGIEVLENLEVASDTDGRRYGAHANQTFLIPAPSPFPLRSISVLEKPVRQIVIKPKKREAQRLRSKITGPKF